MKINTPFKPMILRKIDEIPTDEQFVHQVKWDGHRAIFHYDEGKIKIFTREKNDCTLQYPEFQTIKLPVKNCIFDGEIIVLNAESDPPKPCFESVMKRFSAQRESTINQFFEKIPAQLVVWDILYLNDKSLLNQKIEYRLEMLSKVIECFR